MPLSEGIQRSKPFMDGTTEPPGAPVAVNLKAILMELGNRLVIEHGWDPFGTQWQKFRLGKSTAKEGLEAQQIIDEISTGAHTAMIAALTQQISYSEEMRRVLSEMGVEWPVVEEVD